MYYKKDDDVNDWGELIEFCFCSYKNFDVSYWVYFEFLCDLNKQFCYGFFFWLDFIDYKVWVRGFKQVGYVISVIYVSKFIDIIECYELYCYDCMIFIGIIVGGDIGVL